MVRPSTTDVRHEFRALVKECIWLLTTQHRPGVEPDIALFATRRGASTWVMEVLAVNPGVRSLDQPLSVATGTLTAAKARRIPKFHLGEAVHLDAVTEPMMRRYLDTVLSGSVPVNAPIRFWRKDFHFRSDRLLLKIVGAKSLAPWIDDNYRVDVVHLLRHPVPQSLSCLRNDWTLTLPAFLDSESFVSDHIRDHEGYCRDVLAGDPGLEAFALNWVLENLVMLRAAPERPRWSQVRYEDLVLHPERELERLGDRLHLPDRRAMQARLATASVSSRLSSPRARSAIVQDRRGLVDSWRDEVTPDEIRTVDAVLDRFGVGVYREPAG